MNVNWKEYTLLFNALTDAEEELERLRQKLMEAQCRAEALYMEAEDGQGPEETEALKTAVS